MLLRGYEDFARFVNPLLAALAELSGEPYRIARVENGRPIDADGRAIDDFLAGWGTQPLGHRNPAIEASLRAFLDSDSPSFFTSGVSAPAGTLARRLCERTGYERAFFASGGTEAVEAALKLARAATGKSTLLGLSGAYHGCTLGSCALMAPGPLRDPFAPHLPGVEAIAFGEVKALKQALSRPEVAAIIVEPIQIEGGVRALGGEFLEALCAGTGPEGPLLIADEIQTGLGRCGRFLASEAWPRRPDEVVLAKGLGGGLVPLSCLLSRSAVFTRAYGSLERAEAHHSTFSGNALACVAGLATLGLLDEALFARALRLGDELRSALRAALSPFPLVRGIRGEGLLLGIELAEASHPFLTFEYLGLPELAAKPAVGMLLCHRLYRAGFVTGVCGHAWNTLRAQPPLVVREDRLAAFVEACRAAVEYLSNLG